jgi:outer membrane immunogenic protein
MRAASLTIALLGLALPSATLAQDIGAPPNFENLWDGVYFGLNGGYMLGTASDGTASFPSTTYKGEFVGGQVGASVTASSIVVGVESDVNWTNASGQSADVASGPGGIYHLSTSDQLLWSGAITGRLGAAVGPVMPYVLGGIAFAGNKITQNGNDINGVFQAEDQTTLVGWTAGGGVAAMFGENVSGFAEYRYTQYLPAASAKLVTTSPIGLANQSIRAGLNYHMK